MDSHSYNTPKFQYGVEVRLEVKIEVNILKCFLQKKKKFRDKVTRE